MNPGGGPAAGAWPRGATVLAGASVGEHIGTGVGQANSIVQLAPTVRARVAVESRGVAAAPRPRIS